MKEEKKKKRILDKILMGAVIGGAIGSVIGAAVAPKKGEETRKDIAKATISAKEKTMPLFLKITKFIKSIFKRKNKNNIEINDNEKMKKIPHEINK